eukprot:scaffold42409_cov84-Phaeocystis_antarctica.AAC.1
MAQIKRWRPCPMAGRQNACKQRFWCHDRPRSEKNGRGLDMLEAFSMLRKPRAYFSDPFGHLLICAQARCSWVYGHGVQQGGAVGQRSARVRRSVVCQAGGRRRWRRAC